MRSTPLLDCAGRRRSPETMSGFHQSRPPRNKGLRYPPDPPSVKEIIAVMRVAGDRPRRPAASAARSGWTAGAREQLEPWLSIRAGLRVGALFCVLRGPTRGRPCSAAGIRTLLRNAARTAGVRRRFAPQRSSPPRPVLQHFPQQLAPALVRLPPNGLTVEAIGRRTR
jgi:hypothetical protein